MFRNCHAAHRSFPYARPGILIGATYSLVLQGKEDGRYYVFVGREGGKGRGRSEQGAIKVGRARQGDQLGLADRPPFSNLRVGGR